MVWFRIKEINFLSYLRSPLAAPGSRPVRRRQRRGSGVRISSAGRKSLFAASRPAKGGGCYYRFITQPGLAAGPPAGATSWFLGHNSACNLFLPLHLPSSPPPSTLRGRRTADLCREGPPRPSKDAPGSCWLSLSSDGQNVIVDVSLPSRFVKKDRGEGGLLYFFSIYFFYIAVSLHFLFKK